MVVLMASGSPCIQQAEALAEEVLPYGASGTGCCCLPGNWQEVSEAGHLLPEEEAKPYGV